MAPGMGAPQPPVLCNEKTMVEPSSIQAAADASPPRQDTAGRDASPVALSVCAAPHEPAVPCLALMQPSCSHTAQNPPAPSPAIAGSRQSPPGAETISSALNGPESSASRKQMTSAPLRAAWYTSPYPSPDLARSGTRS